MRYLHVLSIDGAVLSATAMSDSTVVVQLANGQAATIAFDRDNIGGTMTYGGTTVALGATVDALAE